MKLANVFTLWLTNSVSMSIKPLSNKQHAGLSKLIEELLFSVHLSSQCESPINTLQELSLDTLQVTAE
tara:strand:+ start:1092 stop:1295 length:204 start_codon:yes stop_codon:yes gene_type:complete